MSEYRKILDTTEQLREWYNAKYIEMGDGWTTPPQESNKHLDDLGVQYDATKLLLDVGCGAGHFLLEAQKRCITEGMEISEVAIEYAYQRGVARDSIFNVSIEDIVNDKFDARYDYIVSLGSLEHIVQLDRALDNIRRMLKPGGKFYFYCPNELWKHFDQPNERTMTDAEWVALFERHGFWVHSKKRWNDSTAFLGFIDTNPELGEHPPVDDLTPVGDKLNCGSGQRPFVQAVGWINIDISPKWMPDVLADWNNLSMFADESMSMVVSHHSLEHVGCGEGDGFFQEAYRVLKPGGSLLVFVPDLRALAQRWLTGQLPTQVYMTNIYGAYMGDEADRHKWGYDRESLVKYLKRFPFNDIHAFNWRPLPGADIARDWWIIGMECVK